MGLDAKLLRYAKAQAGAALAFPLGFFGTAVSLRAEVGALLPWGPGFASQPTCISDRCGPALCEGVCCGTSALGLRHGSAPRPQQQFAPAAHKASTQSHGRTDADCMQCIAVVMQLRRIGAVLTGLYCQPTFAAGSAGCRVEEQHKRA